MGQVTPLFKKEDELYKKNYRPVTILPILNKIYEIVLSNQLSAYFKDILFDFISAYRKNCSCETTLLRLTEDWRASLDDKELVAVISLDLSKAFDCVSHELLLAKLNATATRIKETCYPIRQYTQLCMVFTPSDILLQTCGTN